MAAEAGSPVLGALCALGSAFTWAVTSLIVRQLAPIFGPAAINAVRCLIGGAALLAWVLAGPGPGPLAALSPGNLALLALSIVAAVAVGDTVFFESTRRLGLARGMTVAMSYPLASAVLAAVFLGEPLTLQVALGSLLTLAGLALIVRSRADAAGDPGEFWPGLAAAGVAALAWAVSVVMLRPPLEQVDAVTAQAVRLPLAGLLLLATPWGRGSLGRLRRSPAPVRWQVVGLGGLTALSSVLFVAGLKHGGVAVATVLSSTAPMFAIPLGLAFLGERLAAGPVVGSLVTVAGIVVLRW